MEEKQISARGTRPGELTPEKTYLHFSQFAADLVWLCNEGKRRLDLKEPLSFEDWRELFNRADRVYIDGGNRFSFEYYFYMVLMRGFKDLLALIEKNIDDFRSRNQTIAKDDVYQWKGMFYMLIGSQRVYHLDMTTPSGRNTLIKLVDAMIPIEKAMQSEDGLKRLGAERHPDDSDAIALFVKAHKNW